MKYSLYLFILIFVLTSCKNDDDNPPTEQECILSDDEEILVDELSANYAHLFNGANPSEEDENINPLIDYIGDSKLLGLGEGTHGTAEFFKMKDKIFRKLVTQKGFKAVVFEIPWGNALVVNDYVTKGIGTLDAAINQTFYWVYDTQEVRDLAEWMRVYNENLAEEDKIHFVGCDPQGGGFQLERDLIFDYLFEMQPDSATTLIENYDQLLSVDLSNYSTELENVHQANIDGTEKVYNYFLNHREELISLSSELEYEIHLMAAHLIQQREKIYRINGFGADRDALMAHYSEWWQRILEADAKVAIWAHNAHVMDGASLNTNWMGTLLRQRNPDSYKNVGFSFGKGFFNAFIAGANAQFVSGVTAQNIPEYRCHTTNHLLSLVDGDQHYLIFDELEDESKVYFETPHLFIQFGAGFNVDFLQNYTRQYSLSDLFDVIIHFDETTNSQLR